MYKVTHLLHVACYKMQATRCKSSAPAHVDVDVGVEAVLDVFARGDGHVQLGRRKVELDIFRYLFFLRMIISK